VNSTGLNKPCIGWGSDTPMGRGNFGGKGMFQHVRRPCRELCTNGWTESRWHFGCRPRVDSRNHTFDGGPDPVMQRRNFYGKAHARDVRRHSAVRSEKRLNRSRCVLVVDSGGPKETCVKWGHIGATWQIRLNRPFSAAMRPYVKLLWTLVCTIAFDCKSVLTYA